MTQSTPTQGYAMQELEKEAGMGAMGEETFAREVRCIDLSDFKNRNREIADQLWQAAVEIGFFQVSNHGIALGEIRQAFSMTEAFFSLPEEVKRSIRWRVTPAGKTSRRCGRQPKPRIKKCPTRSPVR